MTASTPYEIVTERMIEAIERTGKLPWRQPWAGGMLPMNLVSGKRYEGINVFLLALTAMEKGYGSPWWLTYNQMTELGGRLKFAPGYEGHTEDWVDADGKKHKPTETGQKTTTIIWWSMIPDRRAIADGDPDAKIRMIKYYRVFNLDQTEGVRTPKGRDTEPFKPLDEFTPNELADGIIERYLADGGPELQHGEARAWYSAEKDLINLPDRSLFDSDDEYYVTAFHEMTHSTGHKDREDRDTMQPTYFGSHDYGREELVAEMGATFLASTVGITSTFDNSAAYLAGWIRKIREDTKALVWAAGRAQKGADRIIGVRESNAPASAGNETAEVSVTH